MGLGEKGRSEKNMGITWTLFWEDTGSQVELNALGKKWMEKFKVGQTTQNHTVFKRDRSEICKLNTDLHFIKPRPRAKDHFP